jgi:hypothetical protein
LLTEQQLDADLARSATRRARGPQSTVSLPSAAELIRLRSLADAEGAMMSDDRDELAELLARYVSIPDTKGWDKIPSTVFTDPITWDFQSLTGEQPFTLPRADLVSVMCSAFAGYEATHHAATSPRITIDGDRAQIRAHLRAEHWLAPHLVPDGSDNCWLVIGFYDDEAVRTPDGWRIERVKLTVTYQQNAHLAALSVAEGQRSAKS